jgi:hypothetical protein
MGSFFTNVQVRCADPEAIARAIREDARECGTDELAPTADLAPDRSVLILPPKDGWIAIYDEATEGQDAVSLERIAVAASRAARDHAFSVAIHDSDVLDLRLHRDGARLDRFDSFPGYFGEKVSKKRREAVAGDPAQWGAIGDSSKLREAWSAEDLFAERTLARTCAIVGCDVQRASTGYRYAVGDRDAIPEGTITLRFRARARPAWEGESGALPELVTESYVEGEIALAVGDELRVSLGARSAGRASKGLGIRCWGSAIEQGLVEVERFELVVGSMAEGARHETIAPERSRSGDGALLLVADRLECGDDRSDALRAGMRDRAQRRHPARMVHALGAGAGQRSAVALSGAGGARRSRGDGRHRRARRDRRGAARHAARTRRLAASGIRDRRAAPDEGGTTIHS